MLANTRLCGSNSDGNLISQGGANMSTNKNANSSIRSARLNLGLVWFTNEKLTENPKANKKIMRKQLGWEPNLSLGLGQRRQGKLVPIFIFAAFKNC